jgi:hypothetical protein
METEAPPTYFIIKSIPIVPVKTVLNLKETEATALTKSGWEVPPGETSPRHTLLDGNSDRPTEGQPLNSQPSLKEREATALTTSEWVVPPAESTPAHTLLVRNSARPTERQPLNSQPSLKELSDAGSPLLTQLTGPENGESLPSSPKRNLSLNSNKVFNKQLSAFSSKFQAREVTKVDNDKAYRDTLPKPLAFFGNNSSTKKHELLTNCHRAFAELPEVESERFVPEEPTADPRMEIMRPINSTLAEILNESRKSMKNPQVPWRSGQVVLSKDYMREILNWMERSAMPLFDDTDTIKLAAYIKILRNVITNTLWEEPLALELSIQLVIMRETLLENISNGIKQLQGQFDNPNEDYYIEGDHVAMIENFDEPEHILAKAMNKYYDFGYVQANGFAWIGHCTLVMLGICVIGLLADAANGNVDRVGLGKLSITYLILLAWGASMYAFTFMGTLWDITPVYVSRLFQLLLSAATAAVISGLFMSLQGVLILSSVCLMSYLMSLCYKIYKSDALCGVYIVTALFSVIFPLACSLILISGGFSYFFWFSIMIGVTFTANFERTFIGLADNFTNINKFTWTKYTGFASLGVFLAPLVIGVPVTALVCTLLVIIIFLIIMRILRMIILCFSKKFSERHDDSFIKSVDDGMRKSQMLIRWAIRISMTREKA